MRMRITTKVGTHHAEYPADGPIGLVCFDAITDAGPSVRRQAKIHQHPTCSPGDTEEVVADTSEPDSEITRFTGKT